MGRTHANRKDLLSAREREVLQLVARGKSGKDIAHRLLISEQTVKTHVRNARVRLGASSRAHAVALARERNEITL